MDLPCTSNRKNFHHRSIISDVPSAAAKLGKSLVMNCQYRNRRTPATDPTGRTDRHQPRPQVRPTRRSLCFFILSFFLFFHHLDSSSRPRTSVSKPFFFSLFLFSRILTAHTCPLRLFLCPDSSLFFRGEAGGPMCCGSALWGPRKKKVCFLYFLYPAPASTSGRHAP